MSKQTSVEAKKKRKSPENRCKRMHPKYPLASELIAVLDFCWQDFVEQYTELRPAFFRIDSMKMSKGYIETRCAGVQFHREKYHDVKIREEVFNLEAADLYQAIVHSAAHCLSYDRGNPAGSRHFHSEAFKEAAEELGLATFWTDGYGYMTRLDRESMKPFSFNRIEMLKKFKQTGFIQPKETYI